MVLVAGSLTMKEKTERILDDSLPILMRIQAIKDAEKAIRCAVDCASDNGLEIVVYPHAVNYFKGLIRVGRMQMSEESVHLVLEHIDTAFCATLFYAISHIPRICSLAGTIGALALNILKTAMEYYNFVELSISILLEAALPVFHCVLNSDDCKILKSGGGVINEFLKGKGKETISLRFTNRKTGLEFILLTAAHILSHSNACRCEDNYPEYGVLSVISELQETVEGNFDLGESLNASCSSTN